MPRPIVTVAALAVGLAITPGSPTPQDPETWTESFRLEPGELGPTGRNTYFVLEPGYHLVLEGGREQLTITVLDDTRTIDGVETRVVEERETVGDAVREVSRNFFAISGRTNAVYYFGEEVDIYRNDTVVGHEGAWTAGMDGARFGLMMPGLPLLGSRYYQEIAPGTALDRARIVGLDDTLSAGGHTYGHVLRVEETTPLEPRAREFKYYAPGVGLVRDGDLTLVWAGVRPRPKEVHE